MLVDTTFTAIYIYSMLLVTSLVIVTSLPNMYVIIYSQAQVVVPAPVKMSRYQTMKRDRKNKKIAKNEAKQKMAGSRG